MNEVSKFQYFDLKIDLRELRSGICSINISVLICTSLVATSGSFQKLWKCTIIFDQQTSSRVPVAIMGPFQRAALCVCRTIEAFDSTLKSQQQIHLTNLCFPPLRAQLMSGSEEMEEINKDSVLWSISQDLVLPLLLPVQQLICVWVCEREGDSMCLFVFLQASLHKPTADTRLGLFMEQKRLSRDSLCWQNTIHHTYTLTQSFIFFP